MQREKLAAKERESKLELEAKEREKKLELEVREREKRLELEYQSKAQAELLTPLCLVHQVPPVARNTQDDTFITFYAFTRWQH